MNPNKSSEYHGCVATKLVNKRGDEQEEQPGWSPEIPIMKNPEAFVTRNGTSYLFGGLEIERTTPTIMRTRLYSLNKDRLSWIHCASMPVPRCMAAYGEGCGKLYVLGGKALSCGDVVSTVHRYDQIKDEWEEVPSMPFAVYGHGTGSLNNKIYIIGGKTSAKTLQANVHVLECMSHQWSEVEPLSVPRFLHGVAVNYSTQELYVVGGSGEDGVLNSVEVLQLSENRWRFGESFSGNRCAQFLMFFDGELHAVGGYVTERNNNGRFQSREMHDIFVLDKEKNRWNRKVRRIRGTTACSMACVKVSLNVSKIPRTSTLALMD